MSESQRFVVTARLNEPVRIEVTQPGVVRVTPQNIPDSRVELAIEAPEGTTVVREERQ